MLNFCYNEMSFLLCSKNCAYNLLTEALHGVAYYIGRSNTNACLYAYSEYSNLKLSEDYLYKDYLDELRNNELELYTVVIEMEDHLPFINAIAENDLLFNYSHCKIDDIDYSEKSDIIAFADTRDAVLISMGTHKLWKHSSIKAKNISNDGLHFFIDLDNISCLKHGIDIYEAKNKLEIPEKEDITYSNYVKKFFDGLDTSRKRKVISTFKKCIERKFQEDGRLIKELKGVKLWEIRCDNVEGGAIRILFYKADRIYILTGWLKKSDSEGYESNIKIAKELLKSNYPIISR